MAATFENKTNNPEEEDDLVTSCLASFPGWSSSSNNKPPNWKIHQENSKFN